MIIAGVRCRRAISAAPVESAIAEAVRQASIAGHKISLNAIPAAKRNEPGVQLAATARGVPIVLVPQPALEAANPRTTTRSLPSKATMNVHSLVEAPALAAAGSGGRLLAPRIAVGPVTCALAEGTLPS